MPQPDNTVSDADREHYGITEAEQADLDNWFTYHPPGPEQVPAFEALRDAGHVFAETIMALVPASPDRTVAVRHVREAVMNANAALACYPKGLPKR